MVTKRCKQAVVGAELLLTINFSANNPIGLVHPPIQTAGNGTLRRIQTVTVLLEQARVTVKLFFHSLLLFGPLIL